MGGNHQGQGSGDGFGGQLTHNAFWVNMNRESYRLKETKKFNEQNR